MSEFMLTTKDNPFNPFNDFDQWFSFDTEKGYNTWNKVARLANTNSSMSSKEYNDEIDRAMNRLLEIDFTDTYIKIFENQENDSHDD